MTQTNDRGTVDWARRRLLTASIVVVYIPYQLSNGCSIPAMQAKETLNKAVCVSRN